MPVFAVACSMAGDTVGTKPACSFAHTPPRAAERLRLWPFLMMKQVEKYNGDIRGYKRELIKKMKAAEKQ